MKAERIKKKVISKQLVTPRSITCGTENPASVGCRFYELEGGELGTFFVPQSIHEGHNGIMHGGISGAVLDEVMGRSTLAHADAESSDDWIPRYVTAEMTVKYKKPIKTGEKMFAYGRVDKVDGRCRFASGEIIDETGELMVTATGVYVQVEIPQNDKPGYRQHMEKRDKLSDEDPKEL